MAMSVVNCYLMHKRPSRFLRHLQGFLPESALRQVLEDESLHSGRASTFRILCHGDRKAVLQSIRHDLELIDKNNENTLPCALEGRPAMRFQCSSWYEAALRLPDRILRKGQIQGLSAVKKGQVYFQGLSSILPALCLDARPGKYALFPTARL